MKSFALNRQDQSRILSRQSPEKLLETQEKESRNLAELNRDYLLQWFRDSWKRKQPRDPQRTS